MPKIDIIIDKNITRYRRVKVDVKIPLELWTPRLLWLRFWSIDSREGGEVTDKNEAAIRTSMPNTDSTFKDLLIFLKNTILFDFMSKSGCVPAFCLILVLLDEISFA